LLKHKCVCNDSSLLLQDLTALYQQIFALPGDVFQPGSDPASKVKGGDFSNIWSSSLITGSLP